MHRRFKRFYTVGYRIACFNWRYGTVSQIGGSLCLKYFRENFIGWSLTSEIVSLTDGVCVIKATVKDENDRAIATGIAYEKEGSSFINEASFIENCETSAFGRALGNLGIGIDTSIASADEVSNAQLNQKSGYKKIDFEQVRKNIAEADNELDLNKLWNDIPAKLRQYFIDDFKKRKAEI